MKTSPDISATAIPDANDRCNAVMQVVRERLGALGHKFDSEGRITTIDGVYYPVEIRTEYSRKFAFNPADKPVRIRAAVGYYRHVKQFVESRTGLNVDAIVQYVHEQVEREKAHTVVRNKTERVTEANERAAKILAKETPIEGAHLEGTSQGLKLTLYLPVEEGEPVLKAIKAVLA